MANHPNRGKGSASANPLPEQIRAARETAGLTEAEAGALIHGSARSWQNLEAGERRLHPGLWELFLIKIAMRDKPMTLKPDTGTLTGTRLTIG
jgi:DNA (cytosine-5)-methyltransferase 1